jgi:GTP-binding protein EngB required for normal cell division
MTEANTNSSSTSPGLNESQARRLRVTCQYIDKLLGDIESVLNATASKAAFPRYSSDISPAQRRTIEDYIGRVRAQLVRVLEGQGIPREKPQIPASRSVHVMLGAVDIAVEELKPKYMRGYGEVPESVATELNGIAGELSGLVSRLDRYLSQGAGQDLKLRLERLGQAGNDLNLLGKIEQIVRERGLVEFRSTIAAILDRIEDKTFEIAVFGRVSVGKSSLLNAILETDVLPVGVTPITAVPTRVLHADEPSLTVWFSESPTKAFEVCRVPEFATEQQNPGNLKHVTRIVISLPSPRLRGGVAFVDTPGLGSLATSGAVETLAYLPKCDLGVVLIDAGSTLTTDDLQTIQALQEAAVPVNVLLSKADLLRAEDRFRIIQYVKEHIATECRLDLPVRPVSILPSFREMTDQWFECEIVPLYEHSQQLKDESLRRKIGALRESVVSALKARMSRDNHFSTNSLEQARAIEALLRRMTGQIEEMSAVCEREILGASAEIPQAIQEASNRLISSWSGNDGGLVAPGQMVRDVIAHSVQQQVKMLQDNLSTFAAQLQHGLKQCAFDLGVAHTPSCEEFQSVIRGTPVFDPQPFVIALSRPSFSRLVGSRFAEWQIAKQIKRQLGEPFQAGLDTYWSLLVDWSDSIIRQLKQSFETYAESYRAQAEQALAGRAFNPDEISAIRANLSQLDADAPSGNDASNSELGDAAPFAFKTSSKTI